MSLPMALIIIAGEIDLSVESMAGLSSAVLGFLWPPACRSRSAIPIVLVVGALGGLLNGLLVTRRRPAVARRHARTLALYRGLALVVLGSRGVSGFPDWFTDLRVRDRARHCRSRGRSSSSSPGGRPGRVLHRTWIGRQLYAIGKNAERRAVLRRPGRPDQAAAVRPVRDGRRPRRRHPHGSLRQRPGRHRPGMTLVVVTIVLLGGVTSSAAGDDPGRRPCRSSTLAVLGNVLRLTNVSAEHPEHRRRAAADRLGGRPNPARQVKAAVDRARGRSAWAGRLGRPW